MINKEHTTETEKHDIKLEQSNMGNQKPLLTGTENS